MVTKRKAIYSFPSILNTETGITHLAIKLDLKNRYYLVTSYNVCTEKVAEQHILAKCCKCRHFRVIKISHKVATSTITHLAMNLDLQ